MLVPAVVLVPVADNDGQPFEPELWEELRTRLRSITGGLSERRNVAGTWQDASGRVFEDDNTEFTVALSSWWQVPAFTVIVEWACDAFRQEAMFIQIAGVAEIYLPVQS